MYIGSLRCCALLSDFIGTQTPRQLRVYAQTVHLQPHSLFDRLIYRLPDLQYMLGYSLTAMPLARSRTGMTLKGAFGCG